MRTLDLIFTSVIAACLVLLLQLVMGGSIIYDYVDAGEILGQKYDRASIISCKSDSMGLAFRCGDSVYSRTISLEEELKEGEVYIYKNPNKNNSVIHRLVLCLDDDCNQTVFRGDNNALGELVPREWIYAKPIAQMYE